MKNFDRLERLIWENSCEISLPETSSKQDAWKALVKRINFDTNLIEPLKGKKKNYDNILNWLSEILKPRKVNFIFYLIPFIFLIYGTFNLYLNYKIFVYQNHNRPLILPDQSEIILNHLSSIRYNRKFSKKREIFLEGEGFFNVKKSNVPFIINTIHGSIKVLGTSCNVSSTNDGFELGVVEGSVQVYNDNSSYILEKDQMLKAKNLNENLIIRNLYKEYPDWMNDKLVFDNTSVLEICNEISRKFNITFTFSTSLIKDKRVSGTIKTTNLNILLESLSLITSHEFNLTGDNCTII